MASFFFGYIKEINLSGPKGDVDLGNIKPFFIIQHIVKKNVMFRTSLVCLLCILGTTFGYLELLYAAAVLFFF